MAYIVRACDWINGNTGVQALRYEGQSQLVVRLIASYSETTLSPEMARQLASDLISIADFVEGENARVNGD